MQKEERRVQNLVRHAYSARGVNPGFLTKENARRALKEIGLSASGSAPRSNPSPGTKISKPVFGYELFVAHKYCRSQSRKTQPQISSKILDGPPNSNAKWRMRSAARSRDLEF
jgi:hypothetical protein